MQMIGNYEGIIQMNVNGHVCSRHKLIGEINHEVNSYHNYSLSSCPNNYKVLAKSDDGNIEAIKHTYLPWEGWMWHPEREKKFNANDIKRVKILFDK